MNRSGVISGLETARATAAAVLAVLVIATLASGCLTPSGAAPPPEPPVSALGNISAPAKTASPAADSGTYTEPVLASLTLEVTRPAKLVLYDSKGYPQEVEQAVAGLADRTAFDEVNRWMRWESVKAGTGAADTARIEKTIELLDYAVYNSLLHEDVTLFCRGTGETSSRIRADAGLTEAGYTLCSYDPTVALYADAGCIKDREGYMVLLVIQARRGDYGLFVNESRREFLLPHNLAWDRDGEVKTEKLDIRADFNLMNRDIIPQNVRLIYLSPRW